MEGLYELGHAPDDHTSSLASSPERHRLAVCPPNRFSPSVLRWRHSHHIHSGWLDMYSYMIELLAPPLQSQLEETSTLPDYQTGR